MKGHSPRERGGQVWQGLRDKAGRPIRRYDPDLPNRVPRVGIEVRVEEALAYVLTAVQPPFRARIADGARRNKIARENRELRVVLLRQVMVERSIVVGAAHRAADEADRPAHARERPTARAALVKPALPGSDIRRERRRRDAPRVAAVPTIAGVGRQPRRLVRLPGGFAAERPHRAVLVVGRAGGLQSQHPQPPGSPCCPRMTRATNESVSALNRSP